MISSGKKYYDIIISRCQGETRRKGEGVSRRLLGKKEKTGHFLAEAVQWRQAASNAGEFGAPAGPSGTGDLNMVFISYSWDSERHIERVSRLVKLLRRSGVQVVWDQDLALGNRLPSFMEESLQTCDRVLFICTPAYKLKADQRTGGGGSGGGNGVKYETNIITGDVFRNHNDMKYIPVLLEGDWDSALPVWASGKLGADLRQESMREYEKLLDALGGREEAVFPPARREVPEDEPEEEPEPPEEPAGPEERRALEQIYGELLELKAWLVRLKYTGNGGMRDPGGAEDEADGRTETLEALKETYDFLLQKEMIGVLEIFLSRWQNFMYVYVNFERVAEAEPARLAEWEKKGRLAKLFSAKPDVRGAMRSRYREVKDACNSALTAVTRRLG